VDVRLSPEQQALRDSATQVVDRLGPKAVGQLGDEERKAKLAAAVAASGWRELRVAAEHGTPLASGVEVAIVAEELARGLADVSFLGPTLAAELRRLTGASPGDQVETVVLEPDLSLYVRRGDNAAAATVAIDAAGCNRALLVVPEGLAQVALGAPCGGIDLTRPSVTLDSRPATTPLEVDHPLTADDLARWTALGLALTCADLVGAMGGAVALACAYAKERRQYGTAIGSFQAVQHLLADAFAVTEGARSLARHAAWAVDALPVADAVAAAAAAKAYCARSARDVCETAIQVHGGVGNTWECLAHVYLRRVLLSTDICGNAGVNLARVLRHYGIGSDHGLR
jgi:alkylation response protein AidB-like acyl-CoA dehydrogenase